MDGKGVVGVAYVYRIHAVEEELADFFDVSIDYLVGRTDNSQVNK